MEHIDLVFRRAYALRQSDNSSVGAGFDNGSLLLATTNSHDKLKFVGPAPGSYRFKEGRPPK